MTNPIVLHAVGDVGPCRADPDAMFSGLDGAFDADIVFGQMECVISGRGCPAPNARLPMRTPPATASALARAGFHVMSVSGNHAMDYGAEALSDTLAHLREVGIAACGGGGNIAQARAPAMIECKGRKVAFLAYNSILPTGYAADHRRAGCAPLHVHTLYEQVEPDQPGTDPRIRTYADEADLAALLADVSAARDLADHVIVSMHWGLHFVRAKLADYQRSVGRQIIEAGADAIVGHHPHLLKPIEFHRGSPIIHSLGNFAIEQPSAFMENLAEDRGFKEVSRNTKGFRPGEKYMNPEETRHTVVARIVLREGSCELALIPFWIDNDSVPRRIAPRTPQFSAFADYLNEIGAGSSTRLQPPDPETGFCFVQDLST
jgi:poly-gamma-glutamate synthesis protein (capsule biosynthesis protein)